MFLQSYKLLLLLLLLQLLLALRVFVCFFFILLRTRNSFGFILDDYTKRGVDMAISSADT